MPTLKPEAVNADFQDWNKRFGSFMQQLDGKSRAEELAWYADWLAIDPGVFLLLFNVATDGLATRKDRKNKLIEIANEHEEATIWFTEMFRELADRAKHDPDEVRAMIDQPEPTPAQRQNVITGERIPHRVPTLPELIVDLQTGVGSDLGNLIRYLKVATSSPKPRRVLKKA